MFALQMQDRQQVPSSRRKGLELLRSAARTNGFLYQLFS